MQKITRKESISKIELKKPGTKVSPLEKLSKDESKQILGMKIEFEENEIKQEPQDYEFTSVQKCANKV